MTIEFVCKDGSGQTIRVISPIIEIVLFDGKTQTIFEEHKEGVWRMKRSGESDPV